MQVQQYKIERRAVGDLVPYANNARTHSDAQIAQIAASIREFGWTNPILINAENTIIAGHGRLSAARKLKMEDVPVIVLDHLTKAQQRALIIADNQLALNAGWDNELLALELNELGDIGFDLELTGFTDEEIKALMPVEVTEGLTDEDDVPEVPAQPVTVPGDVWVLGKHRVMCGDSTRSDLVQHLMDGSVAEICFTSPPYADQREYNGGKELSTEHLATFIRAAHSISKYFVVNLGYSRKNGEVNAYWDDYISEASQCGLKFISWNIWNRSGMGGSVGQLTAMFPIEHEWILVFGDGVKKLNQTIPNKTAGRQDSGSTIRDSSGKTKKAKTTEVRSHRELGTVFTCDALKVRDGIDHPARFPVEFVEGYIESMTDNGDVVLDSFGGSGSTLIACEKTGRIARLMELDPKYCDVIVKRWQDFTGKQAIHADTGKTFEEVANGKAND